MISALCVLLSMMMAVTPPVAQPESLLTAKLILAEVARDGEENRSSGIDHAGQCKRFQADTFAFVSTGYRLSSFPEAALYMPLGHEKPEVSGRPVGTCWEMPDPSTGNAFAEAARFDYDRALTPKQNLEAARAFLRQVRAGDVLQMLATFSNGTQRGTHTLLFTRPYDPRLSTLYWVDSNLDNHRVDGIRYGFAHAYQQRAFEDVAAWLAWDENNGATLYRVREDVEIR